MMTTQPLITSHDPKGVRAVGLFSEAYNTCKLTDLEAQRLNEDADFSRDLKELIRKRSRVNQYASEETSSNYTYPKEYTGPKEIIAQIKEIGTLFGLDTTAAVEYCKNLPGLPEGAEGWFAIPKVSAFAKKHFPALTDPDEQYCAAVNMVLDQIKQSRSFTNYREGEISKQTLKQTMRTQEFMQKIEEQQSGDIIIVAAQYGMRYRGRSVRRARELFVGNEFGLGWFAVGVMALLHPKRYVRADELDTDCAGDEYVPGAGGVFGRAPVFGFYDGLESGARDVSDVGGHFGSVSAFLPQ